MDYDTFNLSVRKFLKTVGVSSQREIETAVQRAIDAGTLKGDEVLATRVVLEIPALGVQLPFEGEIRLK